MAEDSFEVVELGNVFESNWTRAAANPSAMKDFISSTLDKPGIDTSDIEVQVVRRGESDYSEVLKRLDMLADKIDKMKK